jgi:hypothetical protein
MSAKIANRETLLNTGKKTCTVCHNHIKPIRVVKRGKSRMIKTCGCGFHVNHKADISHLL